MKNKKGANAIIPRKRTPMKKGIRFPLREKDVRDGNNKKFTGRFPEADGVIGGAMVN